VQSLIDGEENFNLTDEGSLEKYLGIEIKTTGKDTYELTQTFLIQRIIDLANMDSTERQKRATPVGKPLLFKDLKGKCRKKNYNYRAMIGMLNYLQGTTRPDISMAVHQCARFCNDPKLSHERAVHRIIHYLIQTKDKGITCKIDRSKGIELFIDADFAGGWNILDSYNTDNLLSRTGFIICYAGIPIYWKSKLQSEISLSTCESEYIALSMGMRELIPFMALVKEINTVFDIGYETPRINCKIYEDNMSCIAVAESKKPPLRTKHIALKYHFFRGVITRGEAELHYIDTKEQLADLLTKPLDDAQFFALRKKLMGW